MVKKDNHSFSVNHRVLAQSGNVRKQHGIFQFFDEFYNIGANDIMVGPLRALRL